MPALRTNKTSEKTARASARAEASHTLPPTTSVPPASPSLAVSVAPAKRQTLAEQRRKGKRALRAPTVTADSSFAPTEDISFAAVSAPDALPSTTTLESTPGDSGGPSRYGQSGTLSSIDPSALRIARSQGASIPVEFDSATVSQRVVFNLRSIVSLACRLGETSRGLEALENQVTTLSTTVSDQVDDTLLPHIDELRSEFRTQLDSQATSYGRKLDELYRDVDAKTALAKAQFESRMSALPQASDHDSFRTSIQDRMALLEHMRCQDAARFAALEDASRRVTSNAGLATVSPSCAGLASTHITPGAQDLIAPMPSNSSGFQSRADPAPVPAFTIPPPSAPETSTPSSSGTSALRIGPARWRGPSAKTAVRNLFISYKCFFVRNEEFSCNLSDGNTFAHITFLQSASAASRIKAQFDENPQLLPPEWVGRNVGMELVPSRLL